MNKLFPVVAKNDFNGSRISLWAFIFFTVLMTGRSIAHFLFPEYAFHEIANFINFGPTRSNGSVLSAFLLVGFGTTYLLSCLLVSNFSLSCSDPDNVSALAY